MTDTDNTGGYVQYEDDDDINFAGNPIIIKDEKLIEQITLPMLGFTNQAVRDELEGMGADLINPMTGKPFSDDIITSMVERAVNALEMMLDITIRPQVVYDRIDYNMADFNNYDSFRTYQRPIIQVDKLKVRYGNDVFWKIPTDWLKVTPNFGMVQIFPTSFLSATGIGFAQNVPVLNQMMTSNVIFNASNNHYAPQLQNIKYLAGFLPREKGQEGIKKPYYVPATMLGWVAKQAAAEVLQKWALGSNTGVGIAGYGISIDDIHTDVQSTASATNNAAAGDLKALREDQKIYLDALKATYAGVNMTWLAG